VLAWAGLVAPSHWQADAWGKLAPHHRLRSGAALWRAEQSSHWLSISRDRGVEVAILFSGSLAWQAVITSCWCWRSHMTGEELTL